MYSSVIKEFLTQHNYPFFKPTSVLFDMDGVLFDSMEAHSFAWVKTMRQFDFPFFAEEAYLNEGKPGAETINEAFLKYRGREATEEEKSTIYICKARYFDEYGEIKPMKGALSLLQKIKSAGFNIVVVTGSGQKSLFNSLDKYFPNIFDADKIITAYDVTFGKPNPEPYLKGLKKAGALPYEAVAVDNAPLGVKSASSAGIFTIGLNTGPLAPEVLTENGADIILNNMKELEVNWDAIITPNYLKFQKESLLS